MNNSCYFLEKVCVYFPSLGFAEVEFLLSFSIFYCVFMVQLILVLKF